MPLDCETYSYSILSYTLRSLRISGACLWQGSRLSKYENYIIQ